MLYLRKYNNLFVPSVINFESKTTLNKNYYFVKSHETKFPKFVLQNHLKFQKILCYNTHLKRPKFHHKLPKVFCYKTHPQTHKNSLL